MSVTNLAGVATFHPSKRPAAVELENVSSGGLQMPEGSLTLLYGFRELLGELKDYMSKQKREGKEVCVARVGVEIGRSTNITPETLKETKMLNFDSMSGALTKEVKLAWRGILKKHGVKIEELPDDYFISKNYISTDPQYLADLRETEMFKHIECFIFPYKPKDSDLITKRAVLFSTDSVVSVTNETFPDMEVTLPNLSVKKSKKPSI